MNATELKQRIEADYAADVRSADDRRNMRIQAIPHLLPYLNVDVTPLRESTVTTASTGKTIPAEWLLKTQKGETSAAKFKRRYRKAKRRSGVSEMVVGIIAKQGLPFNTKNIATFAKCDYPAARKQILQGVKDGWIKEVSPATSAGRQGRTAAAYKRVGNPPK